MFDHVEYVRLFQNLSDRKYVLFSTVLRLIVHIHSNHKIMIRWNKLMSQTCDISNGVKQGGVLSPIRNGVYADNLIRMLRNSKIGCMYKNKYMRIFYLSKCPTISRMQKQCYICEEYAFNATKSQLFYLSYLDKDHSDLLNLTMKDGNMIPYVSKSVNLESWYYNIHNAIKR